MTAELHSSDFRRSTIVKIQSESPFDGLTPPPKIRNTTSRVESQGNRWTSSVSLSLQKDETFVNGLTPNLSPNSSMTKPKGFNPIKESPVEDKKLNSPDFVGSDTQSNIFEDNSNIFKRSETFSKKFNDFKGLSKGSDTIHEYRNSRCIFLSQIHLIFHISITICLIGYNGNERNVFNSYRILLIIYFAYLLLLSIVLMLLLRFYCIHSDDIGLKQIRSEQLSILIGASFLGMINLVQLAIDIFECMHTELVLMPVLEFVFTLFLIHYLLTQVIGIRYLGLRNVVIAHLICSQFSLWLIGFSRKSNICWFSDQNQCFNCTEFDININIREPLLPQNVSNLMIPIIQNYQLLTMFILITIWFTNNQSKISFIRAKLFDEEALKTAFLSGKSSALKGFSIGFAVFLLSIVAVILEEKEVQQMAHILIQSFFGIVLIIGLLIMRRKKKYLNYKYKMNFLDFHFLVYITLLAAYVSGLTQVMLSSLLDMSGVYQISEGITLIIQISLQSFLIRLQRRKFVVMNQIFILSVLSNLSLWVLEICHISEELSTIHKISDPKIILFVLIAVNRFYSALVFYQFWKSN